MKNKRIHPLLISCAIIVSLAFSISVNQLAFRSLANNFSIVSAILAIEYGIYFDEAEQQLSENSTSAQSNFVPITTQREPNEYDELDAKALAEEIDINDQTSKFYELWKMIYAPIDLGIETNTKQPEILVIHTHGTESFANDENYDYQASIDRRSTDREISIAKIATILVDNLNENGISTVYCDEYHDYPEYPGSYDRSLVTIEEYLEEYPSIKMVIDVHRDAIIGLNDTHNYTTVEIDGKECAQLMLVIGTNASGLEHDNWSDNLNNATNLQMYIDQSNEGLMRPINLRESRFNQHMTSGSFILEVGTSGNTLTHAINAIEVFSQDLTEYLLQ